MSEQTPLTICTPRLLPDEDMQEAAARAVEVNPLNQPTLAPGRALSSVSGATPAPGFLAFLTSKYWGAAGANLTVAFMEPTDRALAERILSHANAWGDWGNVRFTLTDRPASAQIRITRNQSGYWSYLGTDCLMIPKDQPTMCLQGFSMQTPESEYRRVVRHEFGHALGCPHEHMRKEIIDRIDQRKVIAWGARVLGWDARTVKEQILTPLEESSLLATPRADEQSIMTYQLPGDVTRDGQPILGGTDLDAIDRGFIGKVYPRPDAPPPAEEVLRLTLSQPLNAGSYRLTADPAALPVGGVIARPDNISAEQWVEIVELILKLIETFRKRQTGGPDPSGD